MIKKFNVKQYCCDDISLIENYDKAIADTEITWDCHHRDEVRELPSGMVVLRTAEELIENGRYFGCPANELIFLTPKEHHALHAKHLSRERTEEWNNNVSVGHLREFGKAFYKATGMLPKDNRSYYNYCNKYYKEHGKFYWEVNNARNLESKR